MFSSLYYILGALLVLCLISTKAQDGQVTDEFTAFFPCLPNNSNITTQEDVQSCDIFVYAAVQLAFERANENLNRTSNLETLSLSDAVGFSRTEALFNIYTFFATLEGEVSESLDMFRGTIGPHDNYEASRQVLSILSRTKTLMISYGLSDARLNSYDNFYRTLPSTDVLNQARLLILAHFNWYRIGILGSKENTFEMEKFTAFFQEYVEREVEAELSYEGFIEDLPSTLTELRRLDLRIILGFFGPEQSREVLCEASSPLYNLTSPQHVWILPSYYNPDWWKDGNNTNSNCTDEEMRDILQSVIFVDPGKYPPLGTNLPLFYSALLNKTEDLFPNLLPEVQLDHLLQHSRAISAYDATLLLIRSLDQGGINTGKLESQIVCELCRIYPQMFIPDKSFVFCEENRAVCEEDPANAVNTTGKTGIRQAILDGYGQVLISQFVDGTHCPIMVFWPSQSDQPEMLRTNFHFVHRLSELIINSSDLELREELRASNIFPGSVGCPENFTWKGVSRPDSNNLGHTSVPTWALALTGVLTVLSELLIAGLITFSIFWRKNPHVKGTSPKLNIVIMIGAAVAIPTTLIDGIIVSGTRYGLDLTFGTVICQFNLWLPLTGVTLFVVGILVKTFRLYRIFHNKTLKVKLKHLTDRDLIIAACLSTIPVLLFILIWNAVTPYVYKAVNTEQPETLQYLLVTCCTSDKLVLVKEAMYSLVVLYQTMALFTAIGLSLFITRAPRTIKLDLVMLRIALAVGCIFSLVGIIVAEVVIEGDPFLYELNWFLTGFQESFALMATVPVLFLYQVILVIRDYRIQMKEKYCPKAKNPQSYYQQLLAEITELTESIAQKEAAIRELKAQRQLMANSLNHRKAQETQV